jgi:Mn2+/Fe2+ NRAMP family transporter
MGVALFVIKTDTKPLAAIVMAQAVTVIAGPLLAGALLWLCNRKEYMGDQCNRPFLNVVGGLGFIVLLVMAWNTAFNKVLPKVIDWMESPLVGG